MKLWFCWLFLVIITIIMAVFNIKSLHLLIVLLTIIKLLIISEIFMEMKQAPMIWRGTMQLYSVSIPLLCFLIINL